MRQFLAVAVAAVALSGCSTRLTEFTALSTKNVGIKGERGPKRVTGTSCTRLVLGIPVSFQNMKDAIDRAIESAGPGYDALEDGVLSASSVPLILYHQNCIEVTGTPVKTKGGGGANLMQHSTTETVASR
jgi:hypothetical protein